MQNNEIGSAQKWNNGDNTEWHDMSAVQSCKMQISSFYLIVALRFLDVEINNKILKKLIKLQIQMANGNEMKIKNNQHTINFYYLFIGEILI